MGQNNIFGFDLMSLLNDGLRTDYTPSVQQDMKVNVDPNSQYANDPASGLNEIRRKLGFGDAGITNQSLMDFTSARRADNQSEFDSILGGAGDMVTETRPLWMSAMLGNMAAGIGGAGAETAGANAGEGASYASNGAAAYDVGSTAASTASSAPSTAGSPIMDGPVGTGESGFAGEGAPGAINPASGNNSILDWLSTQVKGATDPSALFKSGLGAGANFLIQNLLSKRSQGQAQQAQKAGNPLNDPQRQPFQQQANDLVANPQNYFQNNPFAQALTQYYKNSVIPSQVAKSGNPTDVIDRAGSAFATALGGNYNQLLQTLQGFGGFNQGNSGIGASAALNTQGNNFANESFRGLGNFATDAITNIFGDPTKPNQGGGGGSSPFGSAKVGA